jgi:hypothetical protein
MRKQLIVLVLPRLAKNLYRALENYRAGRMNEAQFTRNFENLLQEQHVWLLNRGATELRAALAIHAAVLILSRPGLREDAVEKKIPFESLEYRAIREAARDMAKSYGVPERRAVQALSTLVSRYQD